MNATLTAGQNLTVVAPPGASWVAIQIGNAATRKALGKVDFGSDLISPVSFAVADLPVGSNTMALAWKTATGVEQWSGVNFSTVVAPKALTLHL